MKKLFTSKGISLVQVMVAMALAAGVGVMVMRIGTNMNFIQRNAEAGLEETELRLEMRMVLDNPNHCTESLSKLANGNPRTFRKSQHDELIKPAEGLPIELYVATTSSRVKRFSATDTTTASLKIPKHFRIESMKLYLPEDTGATPGGDYAESLGHSDTGRLVVMLRKLTGTTEGTGVRVGDERTKRYEMPMIVGMTTDNTGLTTVVSCRSKIDSDPCPALDQVLEPSTGKCRPRHTSSPITAPRQPPADSVANWGQWGNAGPWAYCTNDRMVCGFQTSTDYCNSCDDTALNGLKLICCNSLPSGRVNLQEITSAVSPWGYGWEGTQFCAEGEYIDGFRQKFEDCSEGCDDTGTNLLEFRCAPSGTILSSIGHSWGSWRGWSYCPAGQYMCGMQTRTEPSTSDDTAWNGMRFKCCNFTE